MDPVFTAKFCASIIVVSLITIMGISLYGLLHRPSLIKKIIALTIFCDAANTFAVLVGYRLVKGFLSPQPAVLTEFSQQAIESFVESAVDPLPQALVLTAVVIGLAVTAFLVALTLQIYRIAKTTDVRILATMRREV